ncbi:MAG: flagellar assembly protein T N-terminal domain-containing protein [Candidatus Fermentibacteraceae bacterium]|nr:flagellar assembly protein T N-terminal domain-containing protein [Candidatus Fermentibacteraceae bacterium]MBN2607756.1 flagellar assembly protein T N-terminal domain-containing protein [Candidatus Fermentibacteraceae bacterium]
MRPMRLVASVILLCVFASCGGRTVTRGGGYPDGSRPDPDRYAVPAAGETEILAEGVSAVSGTSLDIARDHALDDAIRNAVEQGVGAYIDSETRVSNFQLISDDIYSRSHGYVSSYSIISESLEGDLYRVSIRACVKTGEIEDDLTAIGILLAGQGRPRIMALIIEISSPSDPEEESVLMDAALFETAVLDHFRQKGFPVVDAAAVREILEDDQLRLILQGDDETAALLGLEAGAEIIVSGTALHNMESRLIAGSPRDVHRYSVSTRAVNTRTGSLMAGSALTIELPFSESLARSRAADSTARYLESAILEGWVRGENTTVIVASNADFKIVQDLRADILNGVRGVIDVVSRDLTGSRATMEVVSETSSAEVLDDLASLDTGFTITGFSGNRVEIRFDDHDP